MMDATNNKINIFNIDKSIFSTININFSRKINYHTIYRAVNVYLANKRQATAKVKNRSEVSGGGKKPWRQKGTGRARAGSIRSPLWVGGGIVFGPRGNQNFKIKQNHKEYVNAFLSAISAKKNSLLVLNNDFKDIYKTKDIIRIFQKFDINYIDDNILFIVDNINENKNLLLSVNNIKKVKLVSVKNLNVYDVINAKSLFFTLKSFKILIEAIKYGS